MRPSAQIAGEIAEWEAHSLTDDKIAWDVGLTVFDGQEAIIVWMALFVDDTHTVQATRLGNPADLGIPGAGAEIARLLLESLHEDRGALEATAEEGYG